MLRFESDLHMRPQSEIFFATDPRFGKQVAFDFPASGTINQRRFYQRRFYQHRFYQRRFYQRRFYQHRVF